MNFTTPHWLALVAALAALGLGPTAWAQTTYELEDDEFEVVEEPSPASPSGELAAARTALADEKPSQALKLLDTWISQNPKHPRIAEAYLLRGDAKVQKGDYYLALFDYEVVARQYPGSDVFFTALQREFEIAKMFGAGMKRRFLGLRMIPMEAEAEELLILIQERSPGSQLAERAGKELGDHYFRHAKMLLAAEAYSIFVENYPRGQWAPYARQRQIQANLATFKGPRFDATGLLEAERALLDFQEEHPAEAERHASDALLVRIDESLAEKSYVAAEWYETRDNPVSAAYMYGRVVTDHPNSMAAKRALERLRAIDPERAEALAGEDFEGRPRGEISPQSVPQARPETEEPLGPVEPDAPVDPLPDMTEPGH